MGHYYWQVSYNGGNLETSIVGSNPSEFFFSPLGLVTSGFIYRAGDIWTNIDDETIQNVTWTQCCEVDCG